MSVRRLRLDRQPGSIQGQEGVQGTLIVLDAGIKVAALATVLVVAGCSSGRPTACQCPKPVAYDEPTLKKISQALRALPSDSVLHQAMEDYENERDDLRFCP
jgi:hypothetical protein